MNGLIILAEAFGEVLTEARTHVYLTALEDLTPEQFSDACNRALRELKFFPKIAELRELAIGSPAERKTAEALEAWRYVNEYLRKWGVDRLPLFANGTITTAPVIPERIDYALRRIGGLWALNQATADRLPFMHRDFCEAYSVAPLALSSPIDRKLLGEVKRLSAGIAEEPAEITGESEPAIKPFETTVDYQKRREQLKQQAEELKARQA